MTTTPRGNGRRSDTRRQSAEQPSKGKDAPSVTEIGLLQKARSEKVAEKEALLAKREIEFARFLEKGHDVSPTKPEAVNPARETPPGVHEPVDEIETVGQLLEAANPTFSTGDASGWKGPWNQGWAVEGLHYMAGC